jgi:hypothetical protein
MVMDGRVVEAKVNRAKIKTGVPAVVLSFLLVRLNDLPAQQRE